ncbi:hypothetical protein HYFRA_00013265, partial [Hymenoscyphus fraxineus]
LSNDNANDNAPEGYSEPQLIASSLTVEELDLRTEHLSVVSNCRTSKQITLHKLQPLRSAGQCVSTTIASPLHYQQ